MYLGEKATAVSAPIVSYIAQRMDMAIRDKFI